MGYSSLLHAKISSTNKNNSIIMMSICEFSLKRCIGALFELQLEQVQRPGEPLILLALTLNQLTCHL